MSKRSLIDSIEIKNPCSEDWDKMTGSEQARFCSHCNFSVHNLSTLTRKQAMRLVRESKGGICVRYIVNPANNKPVFAGKLYQITRRASVAAGVLSAALSLSTLTYAQGRPVFIKRAPQAEISEKQDREKDKNESATASVSGTVTDPHGAVIPAVSVTLINEKTGEKRSVLSNEDGFYEFKTVASGIYTLKFEAASGFAPKELKEISITDSAKLEQNAALDANPMVFTMGLMVTVQNRTGLHLAVSKDDVEEVENLISRGENVNERDENYSRITPLFLAVENDSVEIAETLLNAGAKINARDDNKQTPLMRLDEDASPDLVNLLIKHGARVNLTDDEGNTALILAARSVNLEVLRILIKHAAKIDARNKEGRTALMEAAEADNVENVRTLLESGAAVNLKDTDGETALSLTTDEEIEKLLTEYGAVDTEENSR